MASYRGEESWRSISPVDMRRPVYITGPGRRCFYSDAAAKVDEVIGRCRKDPMELTFSYLGLLLAYFNNSTIAEPSFFYFIIEDVYKSPFLLLP